MGGIICSLGLKRKTSCWWWRSRPEANPSLYCCKTGWWHKFKEESQASNKEKLFQHEDSRALERVAQRGCAVSMLGGFEGRPG